MPSIVKLSFACNEEEVAERQTPESEISVDKLYQDMDCYLCAKNQVTGSMVRVLIFDAAHFGWTYTDIPARPPYDEVLIEHEK